MAEDPYRYFRLEARELVEQLGKGALELEKNGSDGDLVRRLLRLAHTLKGAARVVKQVEIADQAHAIEDVLSPLRDASGAAPQASVGSMLESIDGIGVRLRLLELPERAPTPPGESPPEEGLRTIRADMAEMDSLLDGVAEARAQLNAFRTIGGAVERAHGQVALLAEQLGRRGPREAGGRAPADDAHSLASDARQILGNLRRNLASGVDQMDRELRQLRDAAEQLRLVPAGELFAPLERAARDEAQLLGKHVAFEGRGGGIRLDAQVLGSVRAALVQITRNAVAHGIESESERRAAGKPDAGRLTIDVSRRGRNVVFACRDDGRGVDLDAVRRIATRKGLSAAGTQRLGVQDLIGLLLRGGISTSAAVSAVSGRGIGLDVVREAVERLGGEVSARTEPGKGTAFDLVLPMSVASLEALLVESSGIAAAIPLDAVRTSLRLRGDAISRTPTGASVVFENQVLPFLSLPRVLNGGASPNADRISSAVIVQGAAGAAVIGVDRLLGTTRIVMRPLPELAAARAIVGGASLDAEGNPQLVLDPDALVAEARREDRGDVAAERAQHRVLVVDDSLTTRMLEQSILESAGYAVDLAVSGEEGLEVARRKPYDLFLVDVEMPGMDGFTFVERARLDPALHGVPAILVTSRAAPEDRARGRDAGARGYVIKSEFDQNNLLAMIRPLIG